MTPSGTTSYEPEDAGTESAVEYDLAGNPLPPRPKAPPAVPPGLHFAPPPLTGPVLPPGAASVLARPASAQTAPTKTGPGAGLFLSLGAGLLVLIGLFFGLRALWPKPAVLPASYTTYTAIDNSFSCDRPGGWSLRETGATNGNLATAVFESGPARVRVISDATGSLLGDMQSAGNANLPPAMQVPPVQKLHTQDEKPLADSLPGYDEGDPQTIPSALGEGRVSEWTAAGDLRGYRVTLLGREREFTVICFCPERDWPRLRPAFQRIIGSVKPGAPA